MRIFIARLSLLLVVVFVGAAPGAHAQGSGTVVAWGNNGSGQTTIPAGLSGVAAIASGANHVVAAKLDGTVVTWGYNFNGETTVPPGLSGVAAVAGGVFHSVAARSNGSVAAWGDNFYGQLNVPAGLSTVTAVAAGYGHSVALRSNGAVAAWGWNLNGQTAVPAGASSGVIAIAAGWYHSVAVRSSGAVLAWGGNESGQTTVPASALSGVVGIAAGAQHTVALKNDGTVVAWGKNDFGQATVPAGLSGVTAVAAGWYHSVALKSNGTVVAWGFNDFGQSSAPPGLTGVTAIAAGYEHTVALLAGAGAAPPVVATQPASATVTATTNATFSVAATGAPPILYQWQVSIDNGTSWSNLANAGGYSGVYLASLTVTTSIGLNGYKYRCVVNNSAGAVASNAATLTVNPPAAPAISSQPADQSVIVGQSASFTVAASASPAPTFQWQVTTNNGASWSNVSNGGGNSGATLASLTVITNAGLNGYQYRCVVTNIAGSATSNPATLTVNPTPVAPAISAQPVSQTLIAGQTAVFAVTASGTPAPAFQWQLSTDNGSSWNNLINAGAYSGAALAALGVVTSSGLNGYQYRCVVTNSAGAVTSTAATLTVNPAIAPAITSQPADQTVIIGQNATFTVAANGAPVPTYQWQRSTNNGANWSNLANDSLYSGVGAPTLTVTATILGQSGYRYRVVATNLAGTVTSSDALLTVNVPFPPGAVVAWGYNSHGQTTVPAGLSGVKSLSAGEYHSVTVKFDGMVAAWGGNNYNGQSTVPVGLSGVATIAAGGGHNVALKNDGTLLAWGDNTWGQSNVPAGTMTAIGTGYIHSLAVKTDGTVVGWGANAAGQVTAPVGLTGVAAVAGGSEHSVARKSDGTVVAWGRNIEGQTTVPPGLIGVNAIAAGWAHSVALKNDGTVVAWGDNTYGQVSVPTGLSGVTAIAAGGYHTVALKSDGTIVAWGNNAYGQTTVPPGLRGVVAIAAGQNHTLALRDTILALQGVQSRKTHGAAGDFDLPIDTTQAITGSVTVEPRSIGSGHALIFQFDAAVTSVGTTTAVNGSGMTLGSLAVVPSGNTVVMTLPVVADNSRATISLSGVNGASIPMSVAIGFLVGDINNTRSVNSSDISGVKARSGQATTGANFRFDVNATGAINSSDISAVKARSGLTLP